MEWRITMKMSKILLFLLVTGGIFVMPGCRKPNATVGSQPVALRPQETDNWCWAATTQMITEFLGHGRTQCDLANQRFSRTDCCNDEPNDPTCRKTNNCNMPGWTMFNESNFDATPSATPLPWDSIKNQIDSAKKPMSYAYAPKSGGVGHVVVINGYSEAAGIRWVTIVDPWDPCGGATSSIPYEEYSNSGGTDHLQTNYNITWKG